MYVRLSGITKRFGDILANDAIDLEFHGGEIHALLGENGAGKSTLMNILYGLHRPDTGEIRVNGELQAFRSPPDAIRAGFGMVHQKFMLIPAFTVAENVILGVEDVRVGGWLARRETERKVAEVADRFGLPVDPGARVEALPLGVRQRVEILKALFRGAEVLILDEPTAVLTPQGTDELFRTMRSLAATGCAVVFISHKLREVKAIGDRITVIRRGRVVGDARPDMGEAELAALMVGRPVRLRVAKAAAEPSACVCDIADVCVADDRGHLAVRGATFDVRAGEILGIAGVEGNGQTELIEAIMGLRPLQAGVIRLLGKDVTAASTRTMLDAGVGYVPEDRHRDGVVGDYSIAENLVLDTFARPPFARRGLMRQDVMEKHAQALITAYDIRSSTADARADTLSGGNQQKIVIAREFSRELRLLIAAQPTRGIDVGAMELVHSRIVEERDKGVGIIIVSTDLEELLALADRIAVMYRGQIVAIAEPSVSAVELGLLMGGAVGSSNEAVAWPTPNPRASYSPATS